MPENDTTRNSGEISLEYLLVDTARLYKIVFNQRAQPLLGLTQSQSRALIHLARNEGINQAGLADILEVQPISLARTVDRLEADGWVERRANPKDRRAFTLHLLAKARPAIDDMRDLALSLREEILGTVSEKDRLKFGQILETILTNLSASDLRNSKSRKTLVKNAAE
jgi:MarR family transcriptional regulator, transcriptional regulator for hemolysin